MGQISTAIKELDKSSESAAKEVKSSLEMLTKLADAKQQEMNRFVKDRIKNSIENKEVPAGLKMYEAAESHVVSSKGPSEGISKALDYFMNDTEPRWKDGIKSLINSAVNSLLGTASGASSNSTFYVIALDGHAADEEKGIEETYVPIRIDYCIWVYNFKREGITNTVESALVYQATKSLVDLENIPSKLQIEMALKNIGTPEKLRKEFIEFIEAEKPKDNLQAYSKNLDIELQNTLTKKYPTLFK